MWGPTTLENSATTNGLLDRLRGGDGQALAELFARHQCRLRRMLRLRLDRRLQGRVDPDAVLREAYQDAARHAGDYLGHPSVSFFLWLRGLAGQKLREVHHRFLGDDPGPAGHEVSLHRGAFPRATSAALAAQLLGKAAPGAGDAARDALRLKLQEALNGMDPLDREILVLRHFEELSNSETAQVLGIDRSAASNGYLRALGRLKGALGCLPGLFDRG